MQRRGEPSKVSSVLHHRVYLVYICCGKRIQYINVHDGRDMEEMRKRVVSIPKNAA